MILGKKKQLSLELDEVRSELERIKKQNEELSGRISELSCQNEELLLKNDSESSQKLSALKRAEELSARVEELGDKCSCLQADADLLLQQNKQLEQRVAEVSTRNGELSDENAVLKDKLGQLQTELDEGVDAGKAAVAAAKEQAEALTLETVLRYRAELDRLRAFILRWQASLPAPKERNLQTKKRAALASALYEILQDKPTVSSVEEGVDLLKRLTSVIGGDGQDEQGGFDLDAVLNPEGELDLAALCKELGVMD